jgi:hypothetical protein
VRLFINDIEFDLPKSFKFARTFQVNDIGSISDRQTNYSQKIKLPKTKRNVINFKSLGVVGDTSRIPYQFNSVQLLNDKGETEILNGICKVFETLDAFYDIAIYDGYISFTKAIENRTLNELDLTDANHFKTLANVLDSFNDLTVYKYILADYNGKALFDVDKINIDYLVPSLPVSYLWDLIFEQYGFTYEGSVFDTFDFQNLWLTYPKGVSDENPTPTIIYTNTFNNFTAQIIDPDRIIANLIQTPNAPTSGSFLANNIDFLVDEAGTYVFTSDLIVSALLQDDEGFQFSQNVPLSVYVNGVLIGDALLTGEQTFLQLNIGDLVRWVFNPLGDEILSIDFISGGLTLGFLPGQNIDFNDTFIDFKTKDFIDEILTRFSLTPFKDKYTNNIRFLTLDEIIQNDVEDWSASSGKFESLIGEKYIYANYAKQNNFQYKYDDQESDYKDGFIAIDNFNLPDEVTVFQSRMYAPEREITSVLPQDTNVYKLWNKEIKDDETVKYKDLDKRFYLLRYNDVVIPSTVIGSESLNTEATITAAPFESFFTLNFSEIVAQYYSNMSLILNDARLITANIYLNDSDILNLDFSKLKYIKELGNYYLLNKVNNYQGKGIYKCELIRIKNA